MTGEGKSADFIGMLESVLERSDEMTSSIRMAVRGVVLGALVIVCVGVRPAAAAPIASLEYVETILGGGLFQYDFTLSNLGDPVTDAGYDAYDFALFFSPAVSLVDSFMPPNWTTISGTGFVDAFSVVPGASPAGGDVAPGQSLSLVRFVFDGQLGSVPFQVVFANPADPSSPAVFDGTTAPAPLAPVPEPTSLLLLSTGLASLVMARRRRRRS